MTDAQCTAIVAALLMASDRADEGARRARGEDVAPPCGDERDRDAVERAARLIDTARAHYVPAARAAARAEALRAALNPGRDRRAAWFDAPDA